MNNREVLASNIKSLMKQAGIESQAQLAKTTGISQTQIGNILRQEKAASIDLLERMANGLGCEPWLLLGPVDFLKEFKHADFAALLYCYMKLPANDQNDVWEMTHNLYESTNGYYSP